MRFLKDIFLVHVAEDNLNEAGALLHPFTLRGVGTDLEMPEND